MRVVPGALTLGELRRVWEGESDIELDEAAWAAVERGAATVHVLAERDEPAYGINTGFGRLATTKIPRSQLELLQRNLVLSHAVGVGDPLPSAIVRLALVLKIASLARGASGVRRELIEALIALVHHDVVPLVPAKGSVGASGDLAPLAHVGALLMGVGEAVVAGERVPAVDGLAEAGLAPFTFAPKEGLALINGTQVSNALALGSLFELERVLRAAVVTGALAVDAAAGSLVPFDARIHALRGHPAQAEVAAALASLLAGSGIVQSHQDCGKVQDPYSLRCQPQVLGAVLELVRQQAAVLEREANGVSDNPLVFPDTGEVLSGGNFHAEPVAFAADVLSIAGAEIGGLAERQLALLVDHSLSGLPPFLVRDGGVNSGFMIAHVTAASLASENKTLAHPASVDSLPTSANQEDHVSMATFAARKLGDIVANSATIVAITLLAAVQGVELRRPLRSSEVLEAVVARVRQVVPHYDIDRFLAPDIARATQLVRSGAIGAHVDLATPSSPGRASDAPRE